MKPRLHKRRLAGAQLAGLRAPRRDQGLLSLLSVLSPRWYSLKGLAPVPCDDPRQIERLLASGRKRRVGYSNIHGYRVSTVFLCLDHAMRNGAPVLYETMVFPPERPDIPDVLDGVQERYATRDEALRGHWAIAQRVRNAIPNKSV